MGRIVDKNCVDCGVLMEKVDVARQMCPECARKREDERRERSRLKKREKRKLRKEGKYDGGHPCDGCKFWFGHQEFAICCNYIFIKGHRRPCPPGDQCTVKEKWK